MMRLQKRVNRQVGNKKYVKYYVDIPSDKIKQTGWKDGMDLDVEIKNGKLIIKSKR